jgi:hypothetical protein
MLHFAVVRHLHHHLSPLTALYKHNLPRLAKSVKRLPLLTFFFGLEAEDLSQGIKIQYESLFRSKSA